jgi:hypothetical protein
MERIIVRRGRFLTYELLRRTFGGDPNVEIIWDRRSASNSDSEKSSQADRRDRPPEQWFRLDYLFVTGAPGRTTPRTVVPTAIPDTRDKPPAE